MKKSKHWYMTYTTHCPACDRQDEWSEAQYTPKPQKREDRVKWMLEYCGFCLEYM